MKQTINKLISRLILFLCMLLLISGCMTAQSIIQDLKEKKPTKRKSLIYAGTKANYHEISLYKSRARMCWASQIGYSFRWITYVDLYFCMAADTIVLPYTIPRTYYSQWKSLQWKEKEKKKDRDFCPLREAIGPLRDEYQRCAENMRFLEVEKNIFAHALGLKPSDELPTDLDVYRRSIDVPVNRKKAPFYICPTGGKYTVGGQNENPVCSVHGSLSNAFKIWVIYSDIYRRPTSMSSYYDSIKKLNGKLPPIYKNKKGDESTGRWQNTSAVSSNQSQLELRYSFDETGKTICDRAGHRNEATTYRALPYSNGKYKGAYEFNGSNAYIQTARDINLSQPYSVTAWVYLKTLLEDSADFANYRGRTILARGDLKWSGTWDYIFNVNAYGKLGFVTHSAFSQTDVLQNPDVFPLNQWVFVAITHEGDIGRLYQDSRLVQKCEHMRAGDKHCTKGTFIGKIFNSHLASHGEHFWDGMIDEFRIYNTALSQQELTALQAESSKIDSYDSAESCLPNGKNILTNSTNFR